jgi:hypothetical protein
MEPRAVGLWHRWRNLATLEATSQEASMARRGSLGRTLSTRRLLVTVVIAMVGLAACGGGGESSAQSCADFQTGLVEAYDTYNQVKGQADATVSTLPIEPSEAVRTQVAADLSAAGLAAEEAATAIRALGTPPAELSEPVDLILSQLQAEAEAFSLWSDDYQSEGAGDGVMEQVQRLLSEGSSAYSQAYGLLSANPCSSAG